MQLTDPETWSGRSITALWVVAPVVAGTAVFIVWALDGFVADRWMALVGALAALGVGFYAGYRLFVTLEWIRAGDGEEVATDDARTEG